MTARTTTLRMWLLAGCASLCWNSAQAETATPAKPDEGNGVAEVVVNARARTERLIDVPVDVLLAAFMDRARRLRRDMTGDTARKAELPE